MNIVDLNKCINYLLANGFKNVGNPVLKFHAMRSLSLSSDTKLYFFSSKLKDKNGYMHLVLYHKRFENSVRAACSIAHDPILYGLRDMYTLKASFDSQRFIYDLVNLYKHSELAGHDKFIRSRFKGNYIKPRVRATFIWLQHLFGAK